ncbi:fatty acid CoA ligase FadD36 [Streptomyces sp. cf386]|uniref:AMP-binding protein n=1 Tax=Streptomyces sp. cf386 TaxID=1761904 RepID=UPI00088F4E1E|nr:AMP-binding protein [Streptomyces sp. cf386]SDP68560.1 fatty acid CoA ligase FadD36 [Streptomyces sp. cf386]
MRAEHPPALLPALREGRARIDVAGQRLEGDELTGAVGALARSVAGARRVAVVAHPSVATVVAVAGVLTAGATAVPLHPAAGAHERAHILRDSGVDLVLDEPALTGRAAPPPEPSPDETPALILYTSGSTGPPKGVVVPRRAIAASLDALAALWEWTPDDVLAHALPLSHVHGLVFGSLGPLRIGSPLVHTGRYLTPVPHATVYFGVPALWGSMGAADLTQLRSARLLVSGADRLPGAVAERVLRHSGHRILNRYAMTETLVIASPRPADLRTDRPTGSVGLPVPGMRVRLHNEDGTDRTDRADGAGIGGEVQVRGSGLFSGYLGRGPAVDDDGWFGTGDLGEWLPDGSLRLLGRKDTDLIKSGGYRIGAGEVEDALLAHPAVVEAAVIGVPDDRLGQRVAAWIVADDPDRAGLISFLAARLAPYKLPQEIHEVPALPRTALGKVSKSLLAAEFRS